jgi:hypothetical protein
VREVREDHPTGCPSCKRLLCGAALSRFFRWKKEAPLKLEPVRRPFRGSRVDKLSATQTRLAPRRRDGDSHGVHLAIRAWRGPVIVRWLVRRPRGRRSGSLVFPAPSLTLPVARRVFEVFRRCRAATSGPEEPKPASGPCGLGSPSECSPVALVGIRPPLLGFVPTDRPSRAHHLRGEWTLQTLRPARPGEARVSRPPSTDMPSERPLPRIVIAADPVRSRGCLPRNPVPPSWFHTTSAASSAQKVAGLLHPAASHGVRRVS